MRGPKVDPSLDSSLTSRHFTRRFLTLCVVVSLVVLGFPRAPTGHRTFKGAVSFLTFRQPGESADRPAKWTARILG